MLYLPGAEDETSAVDAKERLQALWATVGRGRAGGEKTALPRRGESIVSRRFRHIKQRHSPHLSSLTAHSAVRLHALRMHGIFAAFSIVASFAPLSKKSAQRCARDGAGNKSAHAAIGHNSGSVRAGVGMARR